MVRLDIHDRADDGAVMMERAVELARLGEQETGPPLIGSRRYGPASEPEPGRGRRLRIVALGEGTAGELVAGRADDDARIETRVGQDAAEHRGRRALPVCTGDGNPGPPAHAAPEGFRVGKNSEPSLCGLEVLGVLGLDRRGNNHPVDVSRQGSRRLVERHLDAVRREGIGDDARRGVRPADRRAILGEQAGKSRHAASADPDEIGARESDRHAHRPVPSAHSAVARIRTLTHAGCIG